MVTLIFYLEEKRYINIKEKHIAITFDESQWNNLNDVQQEIIKFVFDFNWEF